MSLSETFGKAWSYLYAAKHTQRLHPEVFHAPPGLPGTEALLKNLTVNIKVGSRSFNSALKKRETSFEEK